MRKPLNLGAGLALVALLLMVPGFSCPVKGADTAPIWGGETSWHVVALTFDDGPSALYTPQVLSLLQQYQAQATFFVLGCHVEKYPQLIQTMLRAGHEVGNHSFSHPRLTTSEQPVREQELERTAVDLKLLGCPDQGMLFRPPYSAVDERLKSYLAHTRRRLVMWNIDSGDWQGLEAGAIVKNVLNRVRNGAIIIFHDADENGRKDRRATVEALKIILPALKAAGYRMVTISELVAGQKH
jgi:peptidoglycan-N-acetylglucosamine deacetylase